MSKLEEKFKDLLERKPKWYELLGAPRHKIIVVESPTKRFIRSDYEILLKLMLLGHDVKVAWAEEIKSLHRL